MSIICLENLHEWGKQQKTEEGRSIGIKIIISWKKWELETETLSYKRIEKNIKENNVKAHFGGICIWLTCSKGDTVSKKKQF